MIATLDHALVATHRGFAAADHVLDALAELGEATADAIGESLGVSTRDVVATLNLLAAGDRPLVMRSVVTNPRDEDRTLAARWSLAPDGDA